MWTDPVAWARISPRGLPNGKENMNQLDKTLHPDIHALECVDTLIESFVASCDCQEKAPQPSRHTADCRYRHLSARLEELRPLA